MQKVQKTFYLFRAAFKQQGHDEKKLGYQQSSAALVKASKSVHKHQKKV